MGTETMESMLELALDAFQSKNFELAADIYECQLEQFDDPAIQQELLVRRADALALGGKLNEAFDSYKRAAELERLRPVQLENLIECLSTTIRRKESSDRQNNQHVESIAECGGYDTFSCAICCGFLHEPVTLPCGHCFCKKCLEREKSPICCKNCKSSSKFADMHKFKVNVVISNLLSKWFPSQLLAVKLRREGNGLYAEKRMEAALEKYNEAIQLAPGDHVLYSNRSQINSSLRNFEDALSDAEMACKLKPQWVKGHIRKAQVLSTLGETEKALSEYLLLISLDPESKVARTEAQKLLSELLAPVTEHVQRKILDCSSLLSSRARVKNIASTPSGLSCTSSSLRSCKDLTNQINNVLLTSSPQSDAGETGERKTYNKSTEDCSGSTDSCLFSITEKTFSLKRKLEDESKTGGSEDTCKRFKLGGGEKTGDAGWSDVIAEIIDPADFECSLCMRLLYEPVTTPCGHTFCLKCLERCLDHNPKCPLCKEDLSEYLAQRQYCKTILMENLICKYLPTELLERQKANDEEIAELSNLNKNVPIFVCTMAFPWVPCPLHIFEPCYRLMIRRCMETGTKQFGMCLGDSLKGFADYGCILEIRNVEFFADGRSVVDTIGKRRFKVIQHHQRDGYNTADIEYLEDTKVEGVAERELRTLHDAVYDQALIWVSSLKAEQKERIEGHFGPMPEKDSEPQASPNGPSWCWWLLAVLPLEGRAQLPFLALTSLKDRLAGIRRVLFFMARNRSR